MEDVARRGQHQALRAQCTCGQAEPGTEGTGTPATRRRAQATGTVLLPAHGQATAQFHPLPQWPEASEDSGDGLRRERTVCTGGADQRR